MFTDTAVLVGAGKAVGGGIGLLGVLRFIRWLFEFACQRLDRGRDNLDKREERLEGRIEARLRHLEQEVARYQEATMVLVSALFDNDPKHEALLRVSRILNKAVPIPDSDPQLDAMLDRLDRNDRK